MDTLSHNRPHASPQIRCCPFACKQRERRAPKKAAQNGEGGSIDSPGAGKKEALQGFIVMVSISRTTTAGFEPTRVTPIDFESIALTARPRCQCQAFGEKHILQILIYILQILSRWSTLAHSNKSKALPSTSRVWRTASSTARLADQKASALVLLYLELNEPVPASARAPLRAGTAYK